MSSAKVTLLDYGMCNMLNVARAFQHIGADVLVTEDPAVAAGAERLVVPGVGAFADSMMEVNRRGLADTIHTFAAGNRPLLGICVGMQILFDGSDEFGHTAGLGILPGWVRAVPPQTASGHKQRVPHIGWNYLLHPEGSNTSWEATVLAPFEGVRPATYFVHSFVPTPSDPSIRLAEFEYGDRRFCAAVKRENITATQFHPERSGEVGLSLLRHFMLS